MADGQPICKCECGGQILGVSQFGQMWTWCDTCTPVVKVDIAAINAAMRREPQRQQSPQQENGK